MQQTALDQKPEAKEKTVILSLAIITEEFKDFFRWWYIEMPSLFVGFIKRVLIVSDDTFSISLLFKTFFIPWHRDTSWAGIFFGITIRIIYLPIAISITMSIILTLVTLLIIWALMPPLFLFFLFRTIFIIEQ
ncbi:hypothetical protein JW887_05210 [Candidatus Dojkabacteria bacterium]|nr:hypothetical protein [Candidatus Dojkabacteria bacterium]